jgi:hypothetical protein
MLSLKRLIVNQKFEERIIEIKVIYFKTILLSKEHEWEPYFI